MNTVKSFVQSFFVLVGVVIGLVIKFARWLGQDWFRVYTLVTGIFSITFFFADREGRHIALASIIMIYTIMAILTKVKTMWKQVALITTLFTSMFATAVLLGGIPAIHNPLYAALAIIGFVPIASYVVWETFCIDARKTTDPAHPDNCSGE